MKIAKLLPIAVLATACSITAIAQTTIQPEVLKGSETEFRNFWDVRQYEYSLKIDTENKRLSGENTITFTFIKDVTNPTLQIDILKPMEAKLLTSKGIKKSQRNGDFLFVTLDGHYRKGSVGKLKFSYHGPANIAKHAPWDGGWVFDRSASGQPFVAVAQEGLGLSSWLPCKDSWADEPDLGVIAHLEVPKKLVGVANGRLISRQENKTSQTFTWQVTNPINNYSIAPSMGDYVHWGETFSGAAGKLPIDYYVLRENLDRARQQFRQVPPMLSAFEYWLGPYPFYEDGYKVVETPYLGMEHQSNIAYGNGYQNGYQGSDLSETGEGLLWDFILVHESGHEWFANNITADDVADMWIHEAFTTYSEALYMEKLFGREKAFRYMRGLANRIENDRPVLGTRGIRDEGSSDMYFKGANMLHTIRMIINNDVLFRDILLGLNKDFRHRTITGRQVEEYINAKSGIDFDPVFRQYLSTTQIPTLQYRQNGRQLKIRFTNCLPHFTMPVRSANGTLLQPTDTWQEVTLPQGEHFLPDENYLIGIDPQP